MKRREFLRALETGTLSLITDMAPPLMELQELSAPDVPGRDEVVTPHVPMMLTRCNLLEGSILED